MSTSGKREHYRKLLWWGVYGCVGQFHRLPPDTARTLAWLRTLRVLRSSTDALKLTPFTPHTLKGCSNPKVGGRFGEPNLGHCYATEAVLKRSTSFHPLTPADAP